MEKQLQPKNADVFAVTCEGGHKMQKHHCSIGSTLVLMRESEIAEGGKFAQFAYKFRPKYIFDLRLAPRLDYFAGSRLRAFKLFNDLGLEYLDTFGRAGVTSLNDVKGTKHILHGAINHFLEHSVSHHGSAIFIFDNEDLFREFKDLLPLTLAQPSGRSPFSVSEYKSGLLSMQPIF